MPEALKLVDAKDTRYTINGYGALNGLQRFDYSYTANEERLDEIGNSVNADISFRPETSLSFEVTDTGTLAALLARMVYDYGEQDYHAGVTTDLTTNAFLFNQDDMKDLVFTAGEYRSPGSVFSEAKIFPYHFVTSLNISLSAENIGSITVDAQGSLFKPIYRPYHTTRSVSGQFTTATTITIPALWGVSETTHRLLAVEINNEIVETGLDWTGPGTSVVTLSSGDQVTAEDRIMVWVFELTPGVLPAIDYVNTIRSIKADRINIWFTTDDDVTALTDQNNYLRVQSLDVNIDLPRDELLEIAKNNRGSAAFFRAVRFPLDITGQMRVFDTTLHKWAQLQGKVLNEAATTGAVDLENILDSFNFQKLKVVVEWYAYGNENPVQRLTLSNVQINGMSGSQEVNGRKEITWDLITSAFEIQGFDLI